MTDNGNTWLLLVYVFAILLLCVIITEYTRSTYKNVYCKNVCPVCSSLVYLILLHFLIASKSQFKWLTYTTYVR
jgi:p-aminobenzoyl-glutamate transporter AbgT